MVAGLSGCVFVCECRGNGDLRIFGPQRQKTCLRRFANNKAADQPVHTHSLISTFVIRFLESIICKLATGEISIL